MDDASRLAIPYDDEFRRAKRNSLVWSGLTVAAALATPAAGGDTITFSQLGTNLPFTQSVIVGMTGTVAVFMGIGFVHAARRLWLYSSQLFLGTSSTDLEQAFDRLGAKAMQARDLIQQTGDSTAEFLASLGAVTSQHRERIEAFGNRLRSHDYQVQLRLERLVPGLPHPLTEQDLQNLIDQLTEWERKVVQSARDRDQDVAEKAGAAVQAFDDVTQTIKDRRDEFAAQSSLTIDHAEHSLKQEVAWLRRLHRNIRFEDRAWLWLYDFMPAAVLFGAAMLPYIRLFVS